MDEVRRRGIDCGQFASAIAANNAALANAVANIPKPQQPMTCLSKQSSNTGYIYTTCQ